MRCVIFRLSSSHPGLSINAVPSDFKFPYDTTDNDESETAEQVDEDQPSDQMNHPMEHPDWPKLREAHPPIS